jgi:hypothetical protein
VDRWTIYRRAGHRHVMGLDLIFVSLVPVFLLDVVNMEMFYVSYTPTPM